MKVILIGAVFIAGFIMIGYNWLRAYRKQVVLLKCKEIAEKILDSQIEGNGRYSLKYCGWIKKKLTKYKAPADIIGFSDIDHLNQAALHSFECYISAIKVHSCVQSVDRTPRIVLFEKMADGFRQKELKRHYASPHGLHPTVQPA